MKVTVAATGRVVSNLDVDIKCKASGEIITLPYDVSDAVKKGDLLVELDPIDEERVRLLREGALEVSARVVWIRKKPNSFLYGLAFDSVQQIRT